MRVLRAAAAALLCVAVLSGCTAKVVTTIEVTGETQAKVRVSARFTAEAAQVLTQDAQARKELVELFTARSGGGRPHVELADDAVDVSVEVDYQTLEGLADLTGVGSLELSEAGTRLRVNLNPPARLREVIREQVADRPDADALAETMLEQTAVEVLVTFAGGVDAAALSSPSGANTAEQMSHGRDRARYVTTLADAREVSWDVTGDPTGTPRWPWLAGAALALLALAAMRRRPS